MRLTAFLLIFLILYSCENNKSKTHQEPPSDFSFQIDTDGTERYDSNTSIFERDYVDGTKKLKVYLSKEELDLIYNRYLEINFNNFPEKFETVGAVTVVHPSFFKSITISSNGKVQKVTFNSSDFENTLKKQNKADAFNEFYDFIWEIIRNHPEVKNLKESDIYFM